MGTGLGLIWREPNPFRNQRRPFVSWVAIRYILWCANQRRKQTRWNRQTVSSGNTEYLHTNRLSPSDTHSRIHGNPNAHGDTYIRNRSSPIHKYVHTFGARTLAEVQFSDVVCSFLRRRFCSRVFIASHLYTETEKDTVCVVCAMYKCVCASYSRPCTKWNDRKDTK